MGLLSERHYLTSMFAPQSVALIGASERPGSVGAALLANVRAANYRGALFAVNPKHRVVQDVPCFPSIAKVPQRVDVAVIATPAATVPSIIEQCGKAGVRAAVVISAGFSEAGEAGARLDRSLLESARRHGVRVLGPNCLGVLRPDLGLNATLARGAAHPGSLGLVSQSAAVCAAMLDWALPSKVGFSTVVSLGGATDIDFGEVIDFLVADDRTEHILLYVEGVRHARRFASALRAAARAKPVILMKVGRHPAGVRATASHTGTIVGRDDVFDAVVTRTGAVRVGTIGQLVAAAQALTARVRPQGDRLAVVTNGGGPGAMAADRAADLAIPLAELSAPTITALKSALPPSWSHTNPVDVIGDAGADRYRTVVGACLADVNVDGVLAILAPQAMSEPTQAALAVVEAARGSSKPVLACWMGGEQIAPARKLFADAAIPVFRTPDPAVEMFAHVSSYYRNQRALLQAPGPLSQQEMPDLDAARRIVDTALAGRRLVLSAAESKALLAAFHIPVSSSETTRAHGRELMAGVVRDPVFGPAVTFGAGGAAAEVYRDCVVALPPLNAYLANDMIRGTRVSKLLGAFRGQPPVDVAAIHNVLLRVSELACEIAALDELEINPLLADESGTIAIEARVVLRIAPPLVKRFDHLAIHPYPADLVVHWQPTQGPPVALRPIRPEDASIERTFVQNLSAQSRQFRFMNALRELTPAMLARFTQIDYDREMAFIATIDDQGAERAIGVVRYVTNPDGESCEFALVIADEWQRRGLGRRMMTLLIDVARARGLREMIGHVLAENHGMLGLAESLGFAVGSSADGPQVRRVALALQPR